MVGDGAERPIPIGVGLGELAVDVDGAGAAEVDVLVVGDQRIVANAPARAVR
jgi:hypothetical protein